MDPTKFEITDISKTKNDPLARVLRKKCKDLGVKKLKVLASSEVPFKIPDDKKIVDKESKRNIPGSISFVPPVAGMIIASEVIKDLIK